MPDPSYRSSHYPGKVHRLRDAAALGQLVNVRCLLCHRGVTYLAADLAEVLDPKRDAMLPPYRCSKCRKDEYLRVTLRLPRDGDWGNLLVRRPGPVRVTQTWRSVTLGSDPAR